MAFKKGNIYTDANKTNGIYPNTVFSAVYTDDMSTTLGNIASYNATTLVSGVNPIQIGIDMDLLWTNASPTSAFAAQTVSVDLSDYEEIYIIFRIDDFIATYYPLLATKNLEYMANAIPDLTSSGVRKRTVVFNNSGATFSAAHSGSGDDNTCLVPYKIYGIR